MTFTFLDFLVLFGIILSLFFFVLILSSKSFRSDVHKYFGFAILSLNLLLTNAYFEAYVPSNGILELINWEFLFPFAFMMYVLKAIKDPLGNSLKIWLLAIPFVLLSAFHIIDFLFDFDVYAWLSADDDANLIILIEITSLSFLIYSIVLVSFSYLKIRKAQNLYQKEKHWLTLNSLFLLIFLLSWMMADSLVLLFDIPILDYLSAILSIFLILITYLGIHHLNIAEQRRRIRQLHHGISQVKEDVSPEYIKDNKVDSSTSDENTIISRKTIDKMQRLDKLMIEDRLFENPDLTRTIVAKKLDISEGYLSELLKTNLKTNFNDYVNRFRVDRVINMFNDPKFDLFSIEAVGFDAGFKSKSVFYAAFKKVEQKTPGEYRKTVNSF